MKPLKPIRTLSTAAATSVLLMTAACGGSDDPATSAPDPTTSATSEAPADSGTGEFADGSYTGEGSYPNPGGVSSVTVTLELADNAIESIEVQPGAEGTSLSFQQKFISGIADEVVGKRIDEISVSQVAGSSLTSQGFNEAIEQIKADATA